MSDIWIKASTTGTTRWKKATSISIKRASATWSAAKNIWIKTGTSAWLRVWPVSGVYSLTDPFIATTASGSTAIYSDGAPIRIGTTYYGRNGTWEPNGFTISSYTYFWPYWASATTGTADQLGTLATGTFTAPSNALTISSAANATAIDGKYISFRITANASNSAYNGTADSENTYGRSKVIRRTPVNTSASLTGTASVGQTLTYSSAWNITEAYKINASRSTMKWYKSASNTDIYEGGSRTEITRASGSYTITLAAGDNLDGYYVIAEESVYNTGSDYDIGQDLTTKDLNRITKVTASAVTVPYTFTFGSNLYVSTNGYISMDSANSADLVSQTTGRVLSILSGDQWQDTITSVWYWSNTTEFRIRWEGYRYQAPSDLRQYEVIFYNNGSYATVYAINVSGTAPSAIAYSKNGTTLTSYPSALTTGSAYNVNFDGTTSPISFSGYTPKSKSVMVRVGGLTSGTQDVGYTTIATSTNQNVIPTIGAFNVSSFTKGTVGSSSQGASRTTTLNWDVSSNATRYEIQYQGSNDNVNWTTVQSYAASSYTQSTSSLTDTKTWATTGGSFGYYAFMRANIRASESTGIASYVYSNGGSYVDASGVAPGQPTFGTITQSGTTASVPFTVGSQGSNYLYTSIEYQYRASSGSYSGSWSTSVINTGAGTISLTGLSSSTTYYIKIRTRNYDELYSPENETNFTTPSVVSQSTAPSATATSNGSTTTVKYGDSITWSTGTYTNQASKTSVLLYSTNTANLVSPGGNTSTATRTSSPYTLSTSDPAGTPYVFAVRDIVVGTNGTTYYFYSNQITSALADAVAFSYGTATSATGGWTSSVDSGTQTGATYSYVSATVGSGTVNSTTGAITASGLSSAQSSTITVNKAVSGYNTASTTATGTAATITIYTLTYAANSGSTTPTSQTGAQGASITLAANAGTRSGFTFGGWNIGGTTYSGGGSYTFGAANATATAIWTANFVIPSSGAPALQFLRKTTATTYLQWYCDYPSISGDGSITGMQFSITTGAGGTGTVLVSAGSRAYPGAGTYPYSANGTVWAFRMGTTDGDITYSSSSRYGRARVVMLGTNGTTYYGTWSSWI